MKVRASTIVTVVVGGGAVAAFAYYFLRKKPVNRPVLVQGPSGYPQPVLATPQSSRPPTQPSGLPINDIVKGFTSLVGSLFSSGSSAPAPSTDFTGGSSYT